MRKGSVSNVVQQACQFDTKHVFVSASELGLNLLKALAEFLGQSCDAKRVLEA
jgi:hypothetical protein